MSPELAQLWSALDTPDMRLDSVDASQSAGVLVPITKEKVPKVVLTQRAQAMSTHSGQVAFPGGRWEPGDQSLADTALRESEEEIALPRTEAEVHGRLPEKMSLHGLVVYPYVASIEPGLKLEPNPAEIDSIFLVPLSFFLEREPDRLDPVERHGVRYQMPAWYFEGYEIWGLTALILRDLLKRLDGSSLEALGKK